MMPIGSTVIYDGKVWNNQVHGTQPVWGIKKSAANDETVNQYINKNRKSFSDYLFENINEVNDKQIAVNKIAEKLVTNPEEVEAHEVIITMEKAKQSLNLAQSVIDRLVMGWNELKNTNTQ